MKEKTSKKHIALYLLTGALTVVSMTTLLTEG